MARTIIFHGNYFIEFYRGHDDKEGNKISSVVELDKAVELMNEYFQKK